MPGHSIAAVRAIKSSLWATAEGKRPETRPKRRSQAAGDTVLLVTRAMAAVDDAAGLQAHYRRAEDTTVGARARPGGQSSARAVFLPFSFFASARC